MLSYKRQKEPFVWEFTKVSKKNAVSKPFTTITKVNQIVRGWINYFKIGNIKIFLVNLISGQDTI